MSTPTALRVCMVIGTLNVGGAETQLVGVARRLHTLGVEVEVLLLNGRGPLLAVLTQDGVPVHCVDYPGIRFRNERGRLRPWLPFVDALRLLSVLVLLRRGRFDVVHAFLFHAYALVLPMAWLVRVPVRIAARRGLHSALPRHALLGLLTALSTRVADAVVANSTAVAEDAYAAEQVPRRKLRVIPNAVDLPGATADPAAEPPTGLILANLIHYKGHLDLVEALARLEDPPVIRCIGEGPMRTHIEAALRARGLEDVLLLEGHRMNARDLYQEVQFAVLTSHAEGMPNAVLEAMAAGLPVVATDVGGCRELVEDGVTGYLVPAHDSRSLSEAIARTASDATWRSLAGKNARERAARFSWDACTSAHLTLYEELLRARRK